MKLIRTTVLLAAVFAFAACKSGPSQSAAAVNAKCLISGEAIDASSPTSTFDGQTYGFCCNNCLKKFEKLPADQKKAKANAAPMK